MDENFKSDFYRMADTNGGTFKGLKELISNQGILYMFFHRKIANNSPFSLLYKFLKRHLIKKYGLEIDSRHIGKGLYIGHPYNITINQNATIGDFCNIHKGVTIGQENRGKRKGSPKIGNKVWIGINSTIVGNITIGDDVLIAPNTFVNCDVPDHSIVVGSPCKITVVENATEGYINRCV